jgi:hypothetical protein
MGLSARRHVFVIDTELGIPTAVCDREYSNMLFWQVLVQLDSDVTLLTLDTGSPSSFCDPPQG